MSAAAGQDGTDREEDHFYGTIVLYFEHAAYDVVDKENSEHMGVVKKGEVDVEADGGDWRCMAARMLLKYLKTKLRTEPKERWEWEEPVLVKKNSALRLSMTGSLMTLKTPRPKLWRGSYALVWLRERCKMIWWTEQVSKNEE